MISVLAAELKEAWSAALPCDVILCHSSSGNHDCSRVLYLHLPEEHVAILCQLDICSIKNEV